MKAIRTGSITLKIEGEVAASELTTVIMKASLERLGLGLATGENVVVIVKSTDVLIGK